MEDHTNGRSCDGKPDVQCSVEGEAIRLRFVSLFVHDCQGHGRWAHGDGKVFIRLLKLLNAPLTRPIVIFDS